MSSDYSLKHIQQFMDKLFGEKNSFSTGEINIPDDREFILLLLAAIRAGERNTSFKTQVGTGTLKVNGYRIPQMVFSKKGGGDKYVE